VLFDSGTGKEESHCTVTVEGAVSHLRYNKKLALSEPKDYELSCKVNIVEPVHISLNTARSNIPLYFHVPQINSVISFKFLIC